MSEKRQMLIMRILLAFFIVVSATIAIIQRVYNFSEIASLMGISWGALAGAFLAPFLYGLYFKKITKSSVWVSFVAGIVIMVFSFVYKLAGWEFMKVTFSSGETLDFANAIVAGAAAMIVGLILVPIVSLCTYKAELKSGHYNPVKVEEIFSCMEGKVLVSRTESLGDEDITEEISGCENKINPESGAEGSKNDVAE